MKKCVCKKDKFIQENITKPNRKTRRQRFFIWERGRKRPPWAQASANKSFEFIQTWILL